MNAAMAVQQQVA